jgi:predicted small lipoprotein YifL
MRGCPLIAPPATRQAWLGALASMASVALIVGIAGCGAKAPGDSYFPLAAGHQWHYDLRTEWENNRVEHQQLQLRTLGAEALAGGGPAWRRQSSDGVDYWLREDASGIYRVASKSELEAEPKADAQPRYVLKAPLQVGTSWQASTTAYLLRRRADFPPEIRHSHPAVAMVYTIEALAQSVDTRAGRFDNCLRVRGVAALRLFADPVVGWRDLPLTTVEWYCKGVGLVRLERHEPAQSTFLSGGKLTMELTAWQ